MGIKRMLSLLLILALCAGGLTACRRVPDVSIVIRMPVYTLNEVKDAKVRSMYELMRLAGEDFSAQYKKANVTIEVQQYAAEMRMVMVDDKRHTDDAADIAFGDRMDWVFSGYAIPLDDILTGAIGEDIQEKYLAPLRVEGKTYQLPFLTSQGILCFNRALFHQAGLDEFLTDDGSVQTWTLDEWDRILLTLRERLPETVYPFMMYAASDQGDMHIMTLTCSEGFPLYDENGCFHYNSEGGIHALNRIRLGVENAYFPPHAERLAMLDNYELFLNDQLAIYYINPVIQGLMEDEQKDIGLVNFPAEEGGLCEMTSLGFFVLDNGDQNRINVSKDFLRYLYETDWLDYSAGGMTVSTRVQQKYHDLLSNYRPYLENNAENNDYQRMNPNWEGVRAVYYQHIADVLQGKLPIAQIAEELDRDCNDALRQGLKGRSVHP